ncbi:MAG: S28 family serine protease [Kofleriaceae bacterium]
MKRILACAAVLGACGGGGPTPPTDLLGKLEAIPGVTVTEQPTDTPGMTYLVLQFTQPVDHADPGGATFQQEVSLLHRNDDAPMVVLTSGYYDYYLDNTYELTNLLHANQISIEHRFFGSSRPEPADWSKLTIEQMANDEHVIIAALRDIYPGAFVTTGGSKGGMTATYHRRFFPDDVDATVPYVAPMSIAAPDARYTAFVDQIGPASCRTELRAAATEMLQNRRDAMEARAAAQSNHVYNRIGMGPAVEGSIASLEWAFWQYYGVDYCDDVPSATASDDALFDFLDSIAPIGDNDDTQIGLFEAYYFQAYAQLGYPANNATYLEPFLRYTDADYDRALPTATPPTYDGGAAMADIASYVQNEGTRLLFIYGEWDPWSGGQYELGNASDSLKLIQSQGSHGSRIGRLADADYAQAAARLAEWTGASVAESSSQKATPQVREPRVPPAMIRGLRSRR